MYRNLAAHKIHQTTYLLHVRIQERFPDSSLCGVAEEICLVTKEALTRIQFLRRPIWALRILNGALLTSVVLLIGYMIHALGIELSGEFKDVGEFIQILEPALGSIVFIGAFILLVWSTEIRVKRKRAFAALHELRSLAHIIDMHQLTKDPGRLIFHTMDTSSSPQLQMTPFELTRYFDYCSELLSMISKISALYAQNFDDPEALQSVDQLEILTNGLSRKIWQKMSILEPHLLQNPPTEKTEAPSKA